MGLDSSTRLWNLTTTDGVRADIDNGFYISTLCEAVFGLHKGDSFTFRSITTLEEHTVRIDGIINFFRVSHEERHQILETEGIPELKSYLYILVAAPIILLLFVGALLLLIVHTPAKPFAKKSHVVSFYQVEDFITFQNEKLL